MKKSGLLLLAVCVCVMAIGQQLASSKPVFSFVNDAAAFRWNETVFDFGTIKAGEPVSHEFRFTNSGTATLVISSVQASCGCTVTAYSKEPISPGEEGFVKATYNAAKAGKFSKTVSVNANAGEGTVILTIKGEVAE